MPASLIDPPPAPTTVAIVAAALGARHGYVIEGDSVRIHADLVVYDLAAGADKDWALQLWACQDTYAGGSIVGIKVSEIWLGSLEEFASAGSTLHATAAFHPPAGGGEFTMVLVLAGGVGARFSEIHSYSTYERRENFLMPRLRGKVAYRIEDSRVIIETETIENPREAANISGTLSLELWALSAPYSGGHFNGAPLAAAVLGNLAGQTEWNPAPLDLAFKPPPEGTWYFTLMLREWSGAAYTTRDFTTFAQAVLYKAPPTSETGEPPPSAAPFTAESTSKSPEPAPTPPTVVPGAVSPPAPAPATPVASKRARKAAAPELLSVNSATAVELATIKGLPKAVAAAIVSERPFTSLDDLQRVKGIGPKLLARLRPSLKL